MEQLLQENQCGFRWNRSCVDQIYTLRTIIHNCLEFNIPLCINFVDFKAAFDSITRDFIWTSMRHYARKIHQDISSFFQWDHAVRVNGKLTDWFSVNLGKGQGDIQGPPLFNFCINFAAFMAETNKAISHGVVLHKKSKGVDKKVVLDTMLMTWLSWTTPGMVYMNPLIY